MSNTILRLALTELESPSLNLAKGDVDKFHKKYLIR